MTSTPITKEEIEAINKRTIIEWDENSAVSVTLNTKDYDTLRVAALRGLEDPWKPIESAPADRKVLVFGPLKDGSGFYYEVCKKYRNQWPVVWMSNCGEPTHWMPLPTPPSTQEGAGSSPDEAAYLRLGPLRPISELDRSKDDTYLVRVEHDEAAARGYWEKGYFADDTGKWYEEGDQELERGPWRITHFAPWLGIDDWPTPNTDSPDQVQANNDEGCHPSHVTRFSDSSFYDEVCTKCGATDITGGGWGKLAEPCPAQDTPREEPEPVGAPSRIETMAEKVEQRISGWSPAKRDFARRVTGCATDEVAAGMAGAAKLSGIRPIKEAVADAPWLSMDTAPKDGTPIEAKHEDGATEKGVYYSEDRYCVLVQTAAGAGSSGPGWVSKEADDLPIDDPVAWRPMAAPSPTKDEDLGSVLEELSLLRDQLDLAAKWEEGALRIRTHNGYSESAQMNVRAAIGATIKAIRSLQKERAQAKERCALWEDNCARVIQQRDQLKAERDKLRAALDYYACVDHYMETDNCGRYESPVVSLDRG